MAWQPLGSMSTARLKGGERPPPKIGGIRGSTHSHIVGRWWKTGCRRTPDISANALMQRLCEQFPDVYPTGAQLRTLQRRVQLWRNEQVKRLISQASDNGTHLTGSEIASVSPNVEAMTNIGEGKI
jgi:hypothetical protein